MHHYAKGVAHTALQNIEAAEAEHRHFHAAVAPIPENRKSFNNTAHSTLSFGATMLDGELEYYKGYYTARGNAAETIYNIVETASTS